MVPRHFIDTTINHRSGRVIVLIPGMHVMRDEEKASQRSIIRQRSENDGRSVWYASRFFSGRFFQPAGHLLLPFRWTVFRVSWREHAIPALTPAGRSGCPRADLALSHLHLPIHPPSPATPVLHLWTYTQYTWRPFSCYLDLGRTRCTYTSFHPPSFILRRGSVLQMYRRLITHARIDR